VTEHKVRDSQVVQDVDLIVKATMDIIVVVEAVQVAKDILLRTIVMNILQQTVEQEWPLIF
jgi:hypothetical protein